MEHTEWEEPAQADPSSPQSLNPSQPVQARTKYSFTGYKYQTDASMHGAARSPLRQLYKHNQRQSPDHAPAHDFMHDSASYAPESSLQRNSSSHTQAAESPHGSSQAQGSSYIHADQQSSWPDRPSVQEQHMEQELTNGHIQDVVAEAKLVDDGRHNRVGLQSHQQPPQQQQQHRRFKVIDFGHADLEPLEQGSPDLTETK